MVLAVFGPTGVGKTGVCVELARLLRERGEEPVAINCDALQVYEGLDGLTGAGCAGTLCAGSSRSPPPARSASPCRSPPGRSTTRSPPDGLRSSSAAPAS